MKKAAIYIRVSTQEQANEGYSVQAQKERLINYCKARDWIIQDIYIDPGFSGSNLERPAMKSLLNNLDEIDLVLVYKLDRLSRSQKDTLHLIEDIFLVNDIDFVSMNESFDTATPFGRAMIGILSVFAQLEREQIKERSLMGRIERAKEGLYHGGWNVPTGYRYIPDTNELIIDDYEASQIKLIYKLYLEGKSMTAIRNFMSDSGYTTSYGNYAHVKTVSNILTAPIYTGKIVFQDKIFEGKHKAIIKQTDFDKVQIKVNKRKKLNVKQRPSRALLTGMIYCGKCGARYNYKFNNGGYKYYTCYSRSKSQRHMIKDPKCMNRNWNIDELDNYIINNLFYLSSSKDNLIALFDSTIENNEKAISKNSALKQIKQIEKQISKLVDLYSMNDIPIIEVTKKIEQYYEEKESLEKLVNSCDEIVHTKQDINNVWKSIENIETVWQNLELSQKRELLQLLISKIVLYDNNISIEWNFL